MSRFPDDILRSKAFRAEELIRELYFKLPNGEDRDKCERWLEEFSGTVVKPATRQSSDQVEMVFLRT